MEYTNFSLTVPVDTFNKLSGLQYFYAVEQDAMIEVILRCFAEVVTKVTKKRRSLHLFNESLGEGVVVQDTFFSSLPLQAYRVHMQAPSGKQINFRCADSVLEDFLEAHSAVGFLHDQETFCVAVDLLYRLTILQGELSNHKLYTSPWYNPTKVEAFSGFLSELNERIKG